MEAELDLPDGLLEDEELAPLADLRPDGEDGLVAARRVFADGRTRAYAWGRALAREDLARVVERLLAMSGQFEQRRLARPAFQLETLDAYAGEAQVRRRAELARAWRALVTARSAHAEAVAAAAGHAERVEELRELVTRTDGFEPDTEDRLRSERDRIRHLADLAASAAEAAESLAPESGDDGAAALVARSVHALDPVTAIAPELAAIHAELVESELAVKEAASSVRAFLGSLEVEAGRVEEVESELERISHAKRRFRTDSYEALLARAEAAREELAALEAGVDPVAAAERVLADAELVATALAEELSDARAEAAPRFADEVAAALEGLGMGDGEFRVELGRRELGPNGIDEVSFLVRPNAGLPFAPVAETASGGELSRIALALRAVAHATAGEPTIVFDEIDAGIGGRTAHAVAGALGRLAGRAQVVTITHLPQIASAADVHFRVEKVPGDPTHTRIERLADDERREELERMLGGAEFLSTLT